MTEHDVGRQRGQVDHPTDVAVVDPLPRSDLLLRRCFVGFQHGQLAVALTLDRIGLSLLSSSDALKLLLSSVEFLLLVSVSRYLDNYMMSALVAKKSLVKINPSFTFSPIGWIQQELKK